MKALIKVLVQDPCSLILPMVLTVAQIVSCGGDEVLKAIASPGKSLLRRRLLRRRVSSQRSQLRLSRHPESFAGDEEHSQFACGKPISPKNKSATVPQSR